MTEYNFAAKFKDAPKGPFTSANKAKVWPPDQGFSLYDPDPDGKYFELVDDDRLGGRCCRMKYPKDAYGMGNQFYQLRVKNPKTEAVLEFDWLAEDGFQFCPPNDNHNSGGKLGPCLNSGEVGGTTENRGSRAMLWWNGHGSLWPNAVFSPSCQDQRSGNQLVQPVVYTDPVETERVYHWKISIKGGTNGYAKYELDGKEIANTGPKNLQAGDDDDILLDFAFFAGGGSADYAPEYDCYARHGNVKWYSAGSDSSSGSGDRDEGEAPPATEAPPPVTATTPPPTGETSYSLAVGETKIFRAYFPEDPQGAVKWKLDPNLVSWGAEAGPNWSAIQVKGKTEGAATLIATDPVTGISTKPIKVDITKTPRADAAIMGVCTVEPLADQGRSVGDFKDSPP